MSFTVNLDKNPEKKEGSLHGIVANVLNCNILVSKFKLMSRYNILFWTYTLRKRMNIHIPLSCAQNSTIHVLQQGWLIALA